MLDIAMADGVLGFASAAYGALFAGEPPARGAEALSGGIAPYQTYLSADDQPLALAALEPKFWAAFCAGVGLESDATAFFPGPHQADLKARVAAIFRARPRREWEAFAAATDCCLEPVLAPAELRDDPQLKARGLFFDLSVDGQPVGQYRTPVTPAFDPTNPPTNPPRSGEHSDAILKEAGLSDEEIAGLRAAGAVR
jgi:crotonobetainyl-CoA:carnitine CoA-transferase CaiB-like acyl-CoA transferase